MGLDTSHNCFNGSYSTFNDFRYWLASKIDINLDEYQGYRGNGTKDLDELINIYLYPLLIHSDCEGSLSVNESEQIVKGLCEILENLNNNELSIADKYYKRILIDFIDGCNDAINKNEKIEFS